MSAFAGSFDADSLLPSQAAEVVRVCAAMEASVASIKALAAARSAQSNGWQQQGYRSPADQLAHEAGMSPAAAKRVLETGRRMADQPEVARAALAGELTLEQATAVSDGAAVNPGSTRHLIEHARRSSLPELNEEVARTKAAALDQHARREARHARRAFRRWTDRDGALQAHLYGHPEDGARLWQALDPIRRRLIVLRRAAGGGNEPLDALDYDAIMTLAAVATGQAAGELAMSDLLDLGLFPQLDPALLARRAYPSDAGRSSPDAGAASSGGAEPRPRRGKKLAGSPMRVMVRVDLDTLLRGVPLEGELCEIAGHGPVPVSVIEELAASGNAFLVGVLTKAETVLGVYHHGKRYPNAHQRSGLDFVYPACAATGCSARAGLQYDHRRDYAKTHYTAFDLIDRLCPHHHRLKTNHGWALAEGTGKRPFVPPEDPRHPRTAQQPTRSGPDPPP